MPGFEFFGEDERKEVNDVLESGILMRYGFDGLRNGNWKARELEDLIKEKFSCRHAQLVSSGTAALTTALAALGVGYGDEVIMPTFTFVASFEAVLSVGAIPVLADIDETLTLSPSAVKNAITPKTKCVMPVHMCGSMARLDELMAICSEHNLVLLEDACQSFGATYKGRYLGTIGHAGTFSFDFVKTITCGEGGAIVTNDDAVYTKCDGYSDHGHDHNGNDRGAETHPFIGYNFRISELHAAVGVGQIKKLDKFLEIQKNNHAALKATLSGIEGILFREIPDEKGDSCTFLSWFLPNEELAEKAINAFKENGIAAGNFYWYNNNWHYIKKWHHLKNAQTLYPLNPLQANELKSLEDKDFSASDAVMKRCISTSIPLSLSVEQMKEKGSKMADVLKSVLSV